MKPSFQRRIEHGDRKSSVGERMAVLLTAITLATPVGAADLAVGVAAGAAGGRVLLPVTLSSPGAAAGAQFDVIYGTQRGVSEPVLRGVALTTHAVHSQLRSDGRRRVLIFSNPTAPLAPGADGAAAAAGAAVAGAVTVTAPALPRVSTLRFTGAEGVVVEVTGSEGAVFRVEVSIDLVQWDSMGTVSIQNGGDRFTDPQAAGFSARYYRFRPL